MKKFKEFKSEQQVISEVGPIGAVMMGAMGLFGAWKAFKGVKEKIKGWKESKAEKKANEDSGVDIEIKKINPETGEEYSEIKTLTGKEARLDSDGVVKKQKELQKKYDTQEKGGHKKTARKNQRAALEKSGKIKPGAPITKDLERDATAILKDPEGAEKKDKEEKEKKEKEAQDTKDKEERGGIEDVKDAEDYFKNNREAPKGWKDVRTPKEKEDGVDFKGKILTRADAKKYEDKKERLRDKRSAEKKAEDDKKDAEIAKRKKERETKAKTDKDKDQKTSNNQSSKTTTTPKRKPGDLSGVQTAGVDIKMLKFGEFITEDVMKDLKLASKSKKDSEITLDDGTDIPMDAFTAEILVKYIEGLSSSEKNRVIKQIQRTERAFMKVLGKAHEG